MSTHFFQINIKKILNFKNNFSHINISHKKKEGNRNLLEYVKYKFSFYRI